MRGYRLNTKSNSVVFSVQNQIDNLILNYSHIDIKGIIDITFKDINQPNIISLNLSNNALSILKTNQFSYLYDSTNLDLRNNEIFYFEQNTFNGLFKLENLTLSNNQLTELKEEVFNNLIECLFSVFQSFVCLLTQ